MKLFWQRQRCQWKAYSEGTPAGGIAMLDEKQYAVAAEIVRSVVPHDRRSRVLRASAVRSVIDLQPDIAALRNHLDNWNSYGSDLDRHELAVLMRPDVLRLMKLRDNAARHAGFASYPDAVLSSEELDPSRLYRFLANFLSEHLSRARSLAETRHMTLSAWFRQLDGLAAAPEQVDPTRLWHDLMDCLELDGSIPAPVFVIRNEGMAGYSAALHVPEDVRILARPPCSLHQWNTLVHEMGHALEHRSCRQQGILSTWTATEDEVSAIIIEHLGGALLLRGSLKQAAADIQLLEAVRCCISMLFELDLWKDSENAERLYGEWYGKLVSDTGDPALWALDSFRSIDPMSIFAYVIGYAAGKSAVRNSIKGPFLTRQLFAPGRSRPLLEKLVFRSVTCW